MSITQQCEVCSIVWDPRSAEHRRGIDCATGLAASISAVTTENKKLLYILQEMKTEMEANKNATVDAMRVVTDRHQELQDRFDKLAIRVNVLEHPELKKVPSIKASLDK
jgi:hypothetical protein